MNINSGTWDGVRMTCSTTKPVKKIEWLDVDGRRRDSDAAMWRHEQGVVSLTIPAHVPPLRTVACILTAE